MPRTLFDELANWAGGVDTSSPTDQLAAGFVPRARNSMITSFGTDTADIGKRKGALTLNTTPVTGSPAVWGFQYKKKNGSKQTLLVSSTGRLDKLNTDFTLTTINAVAFTSGASHIPAFAVANDLCFIVNDVDQKKYDGTNFTAFGITRPAAPTATAAAGGAMAAGAWDVALTYYNSVTGQESSLSDYTTVNLSAGNLQINVSWPAPADAQVTHVRVYIRQESAGQNFYRAVAGATPAPDATYGGYVPATTATTLNISATQYAAFILVAPTTTENNPPPSGAQYPVWHNQRLFLADSGNIYYSGIKNNTSYPESFDPQNFQPVSPNDGDVIVGLASMWGSLYIFKQFSVYELVGTDPNSWYVRLVSSSNGCSSHASIVSADGNLYWWDGLNGPTAYDGSGVPVSLGKLYLQNTINATTINQTALTTVCAGVDAENQTIVWAYPEVGGTRNTLLTPFNYRLRKFHAEFWNPFDVNSLFVVQNSDQLKALYVGGYAGQVFQWAAATNDGVPAGTTTHGTVTSVGANTLTDTSASFATTGGGLVERYVYAISKDGLTVERNRITANTGTVLTCASNWTNTINSTWTYVVGGIDWQVDTPWVVNQAYWKKRFEFLFATLSTTDASVSVAVDIFTSQQDLTFPRKTVSLSLASPGAVYDASTSLYDTTTFGLTPITNGKIRVALTGKSWRARFRNIQPDQSVTLLRVAMQSQALSIKT